MRRRERRGQMDERRRGFILRRRKRENHIDAENTTSKNVGDRLEVYDTSFFSYRTSACTLRSSITFCRLALTGNRYSWQDGTPRRSRFLRKRKRFMTFLFNFAEYLTHN